MQVKLISCSFTHTVGGILSKYIRAKIVLNGLPVGGILRGKSKDTPTGVYLRMDRWLCLSNQRSGVSK